MNKIPVLVTIRAAYTFTFHYLGAIIGAIWLPMVILTVTGFFVMQRYYDAAIDALSSGTPAALGPVLLLLLGYLLVALLLQATVYVAVTQLALGNRQGGLMHFSLGAGEWRLFRSLISLMGLAMLLAIIMALAEQAAVLGLRAAALPPLPVGIVMALLRLAFVCGLLFLVLRFVFLLPVLAVSESGPMLPRAWLLSRGNFWRIFAIYAVLFAPVLFVLFGVEFWLLNPSSFLSSTGVVNQVGMFRRMREILPVLQGLLFFLSPILSGLPVGASVSAWRAFEGTQGAENA